MIKERRAYHPIEKDEARHLVGQNIICANTKEGLGYWATLEGIDDNSEFPYICKLDYNKKIKNFKWIAND